MFEKIYALRGNFYYKKRYQPNMLLVGYEEYHQIASDPNIYQMCRFDITKSVLGMEIIIVDKKNYLKVAYAENEQEG